ncbi:MAG: NADH-quinone oxidoreductase subunit J [Terriglobia bacterium]
MAILFYIAAALAIIAGLSVILHRTPVYSALSLIVVLGALAVIYLLLGAPFIAMIQVIVYAGAIMVLFVMVIMLLNARREQPIERSRLAHYLGVPVLIALLVEILFAVWRQFPVSSTPPAVGLEGDPASIGHLLFRTYVLPFEVTSILILVAMLGAVILAKKQP